MQHYFQESPAFVFRTSKNINWQSRMESNKTVCALYISVRQIKQRFHLDESAF